MPADQKPLRTLTLAEVLAGVERAEARIAKWPAWKRELNLTHVRSTTPRTCRTMADPTQPPPSDQPPDDEAARVWRGLNEIERAGLEVARARSRNMPPSAVQPLFRAGLIVLGSRSWLLSRRGRRVAACGRTQGAT